MNDGNIEERLQRDPLLKRAMEEVLKIQPRFNPDPTFSKTGVGVLKSEGVAELQKIKDAERSKVKK